MSGIVLRKLKYVLSLIVVSTLFYSLYYYYYSQNIILSTNQIIIMTNKNNNNNSNLSYFTQINNANKLQLYNNNNSNNNAKSFHGHGCMPLSTIWSTTTTTNGINNDQEKYLKKSQSGIVNLIHLVYANTAVPEPYFNLIRKCFDLNSNNMMFVLWTNDDAKQFLTDHYLNKKLTHFDSLSFELERSDMIRYFILLHYGGFYMDMDAECRKPLWPLLQQHACLLDREDESQSQLWHNEEYIAMNSAMGCRANHPFFSQILDALPMNLKRGGNVIDRTGPKFLTRIFNEYNKSQHNVNDQVILMPSWAFSPLKDKNPNVLSDFRKRCEDKKALEKPWIAKGCATWKQQDNMEIGNLVEKTKDSYLVHHFMHLGHSGGGIGGRGLKKQDLCSNSDLLFFRYAQN